MRTNRVRNENDGVEFVREGIAFTGDDNAVATFLLHVMRAFADFGRSLIRERQREGAALAQQRRGDQGRTPSRAPQAAVLRRTAAEGVPKTVLARELGISRETVYAYLRAGVDKRRIPSVAKDNELARSSDAARRPGV